MAVVSIVGGPQANASASGNKTYAYNNISTAFAVVAPANVNRRKLVFHNPGSVDIFVAPTEAYASVSAAAPTSLIPSVSSLGGCWRVFSNGGTLTLEGEIQGPFQAASASGSGNALTVMDSNI